MKKLLIIGLMAYSVLFVIGCDTASGASPQTYDFNTVLPQCRDTASGASPQTYAADGGSSQIYKIWIAGTAGVNESIPDGKKYNILHSPEQARILRAEPEFKEKNLTKDEFIALLKSNGFTNAEANVIFNGMEQGDAILDFNFDNFHYIIVSE